jgi:N-acetyl sugar amidotransferase
MTTTETHRRCSRCVLDTTVPDITFDDDGICNYCHGYDDRIAGELRYDDAGQARLAELVEGMKQEGKKRGYDCIIGVSGGVDSTYVAYLAKKKHGLNPLAIHLDNGWNSELAVQNIEQTLRRLDIDLHTDVLDWEEFRDLQRSFLEAGIANAEIPTDQAISSSLFRAARRHRVHVIINGSNLVTEAVLPASWMYDSYDTRLIKAVNKRFGTGKLDSFPLIGYVRLGLMLSVGGYKVVNLLNYEPYDRDEAKRVITEELGWRDYGGKHHESIFTKFFQGYILPVRFGIDKRKAHFSNLVLAGQMDRDDALAELEQSPYPTDELERDREYVSKKLGYTPEEFDTLMVAETHPAQDYPNSEKWRRAFAGFGRLARRRAMR